MQRNKPEANAAAAKKPDLAKQKLSTDKKISFEGRRKLDKLMRRTIDSDKEEKEVIGTVRRLLKLGAGPNAIEETVKWTQLMYAVNNKRMRVCELLIENGADVNANSGGETPLTIAAAGGNSAMCALLLVNGADPYEKIKGRWIYEGKNSIEIAKLHKKEKTARFILSYALEKLLGKEDSKLFLSRFAECVAR